MLTRVYGESALPVAERDAAILARAIVERRATTVNAREVRRKWGLAGLRDAGRIAAAAIELVQAGWLVAVQSTGAGRKPGEYSVNPNVFAVFTG